MKRYYNKLAKWFFARDNKLSRFSVQLKRECRIKQFNKKDKKVLEISGGSRPLSSGYLNVDISTAPEVDVITNITNRLPFDDGSIDKIISVATLEHINMHDVHALLCEFYRILKKGGCVEIGVPALNKIIEQYNNRGCDDVVMRYLHGGLKDQYDVHLFVVDSKRFIAELDKAGFKDAEEATYDFPRHDKDFMMKIIAKK